MTQGTVQYQLSARAHPHKNGYRAVGRVSYGTVKMEVCIPNTPRHLKLGTSSDGYSHVSRDPPSLAHPPFAPKSTSQCPSISNFATSSLVEATFEWTHMVTMGHN